MTNLTNEEKVAIRKMVREELVKPLLVKHNVHGRSNINWIYAKVTRESEKELACNKEDYKNIVTSYYTKYLDLIELCLSTISSDSPVFDYIMNYFNPLTGDNESSPSLFTDVYVVLRLRHHVDASQLNIGEIEQMAKTALKYCAETSIYCDLLKVDKIIYDRIHHNMEVKFKIF